MLTDQQVINQIKTGNTQAFAVLFNNYKRRIFSVCLRMVGDRAIAEDLTQEAFMLAFRRLHTFRGDSAFSTWLHRITVNTVLMHIRQKRSRVSLDLTIDEMNASEDSPRETIGAADQRLIGAVDRVALADAIDQLAPGYRIVFVLHDVEGYNHLEIAEMLGCSAGNTKSQLHKARLRLRGLLRGEALNHNRVPSNRMQGQRTTRLQPAS